MTRDTSLFTTACAALALSLLLCASPGPNARAFAQKRESSGKGVAEYSCPMHPSVKSSKPGECPKCGMALRQSDDDGEAHAKDGRKVERAAAPSGINIPDVELLDQDGRKVRFYTDLVKGKVVAINFIFTTCTTICPPINPNIEPVDNTNLKLPEKINENN